MSVKTYAGSCHCGKVRFEADLDLTTGSGKCNCSICAKTRNWSMLVKPDAFRLLAGQEDLGDYQFGSKVGHHQFCRNCGVHVFGRGHLEQLGGAYYSVKLACLDGADVRELASAPVRYFDGRNNNWYATPGEVRHL